MRRPRTVPATVHEVGAIIFGVSLAILAGVFVAQGRPVEPWLAAAITAAVLWFFGSLAARRKDDDDG